MSLGQTLRSAREAQGLSLEQLHSGTRIPFKLLAALEADDSSPFSSAFLYRSFVRQVAEFLGLGYAALEARVQDTAASMPQPRVPGEGTQKKELKVPGLRLGRRRNSRWVQSLASLSVALVACSAFYALWQTAKSNHAASLQQMNSAGHVASSPALASPPAAAQPPGLSLTVPPSPPHGKNSFTLELSATEPTWLSIVADGRVSFKGILERAETKVLEGHRTARVHTGNAGALEAVFNGKAIGTLGSPGQVRTVVFTGNNYQVLDGSSRVSFFRSKSGDELPLVLLRPVRLPAPM